MSNARDKANIPSLNFSSTGIDDNATGTAITINSSQQVGIGTASAGYPLEINSSAQTTLLHLVSTAGTSSAITFANTGSNDSITIGAENDDLKLRTDDGVIKFFTNENSEKMRIDSSGNVGIGTTSVQGGTAKSLQIADSSSARLLLQNTGGGRTYGFFTGTDGKLGLYDYTTSAQRLAVDTSGNVGIGETAPLGKLHVKSADSGASVNSGHNQVIAENSGNSGMTILSGASSNGAICFGDSGNNCIGYVNYAHNGNALTFGVNNAERMRINSSGEISIGSTNVTQNSHFNVRQDNNSHATRTYINANVASGALYSIKYLGTIPVVSSGTQLLIPFISQSNINSKTYVHIRGMSCESNTSDPKAFDVKFSIGHISSLGTLTVLQRLGTCSAVSKSGMNVVLSFAGTNYQHSGDNGMFIEIDYIAHHQDASIDLSGIVMN